jgi:hypothetical protein
MKHFINFQNIVLLILCISSTASNRASAWTMAHVFNVDVTVEVAEYGLSTVTTQVRFVVDGGRFHGFELMDLHGAEIKPELCRAATDGGRLYRLKFRRLRNGTTRVLLADDEEMKRGGITFALVHEIDLQATGFLREYKERARLDWTPIVWDEGIDSMSVHVVLPNRGSKDANISVVSSITKDYEVEVKQTSVLLTKYRPVRWYAMRVAVDFNPELVSGLTFSNQEEDLKKTTTVLAENYTPSGALIPLHLRALPLLVTILGLIVLMFKSFHIRRVSAASGRTGNFSLLSHTSVPARAILSIAVVCLALITQYFWSLSASVPPLVLLSALWMMKKDGQTGLRPRPGGTWRRMSDEDVLEYNRLTKTYQKSRRSLLDITSIGGVVAFCGVLAGLAIAVVHTRTYAAHIGWAIVIDGLILAVPAWFGSVRAELPVNPTLEGYSLLKRWRKSVSKLIGAKSIGSEADFWIREDAGGPIEVRLQANPPLDGLNRIEVAGEVLRAGTLYKTRTVVVIRLKPGTEAARRLAACPFAAEHHLTPDYKEELVVLRNRRGNSISGLTPVRAALSLL